MTPRQPVTGASFPGGPTWEGEAPAEPQALDAVGRGWFQGRAGSAGASPSRRDGRSPFGDRLALGARPGRDVALAQLVAVLDPLRGPAAELGGGILGRIEVP